MSTLSTEDLSLPEGLLLVALRDEEGRIIPSSSRELPSGLAGAVLLELARRGCLRLEDEGWTATEDAAPGDPVLAQALECIDDADEPKGSMHWLRTLPNLGDDGLRDALIEGLVRRGVLKEVRHRFLGLVPYHLHPAAEASPEDDLRERLRQVVLEEREDPRGSFCALLTLLETCDLTDEVFSAEERREHRRRIDTLTEERRVAQAVAAGPSEEAARAILVASSALAATRTTP